MNLRGKIYAEIRRLELGENDLWSVQRYEHFKMKLNPLEQSTFYNELDNLCDMGILRLEPHTAISYNYRLTKKGVETIYHI